MAEDIGVGGWACYLCGKMPEYLMAGERLFVLDTEARLAVMVCSECVDKLTLAAVRAKHDSITYAGKVRDGEGEDVHETG